jgi:hypothetical protein
MKFRPLQARSYAIALLTLGLSACTHEVGFDAPELPEPLAGKSQARVSLFMPVELSEAQYSPGSGIGDTWVVKYGERVREVASSYLSASFETFDEINRQPPNPRRELDIRIANLTYAIEDQAAKIGLQVEVTDLRGEIVLSKRYAAEGESGTAKIVFAGRFGQKSATRKSTNQALDHIFLELVTDLRKGLD